MEQAQSLARQNRGEPRNRGLHLLPGPHESGTYGSQGCRHILMKQIEPWGQSLPPGVQKLAQRIVTTPGVFISMLTRHFCPSGQGVCWQFLLSTRAQADTSLLYRTQYWPSGQEYLLQSGKQLAPSSPSLQEKPSGQLCCSPGLQERPHQPCLQRRPLSQASSWERGQRVQRSPSLRMPRGAQM